MAELTIERVEREMAAGHEDGEPTEPAQAEPERLPFLSGMQAVPQDLPQQQPAQRGLAKTDARIAVTHALSGAAQWCQSLEALGEALPLGTQYRAAVENARRLAGDAYNSLAAAAGLLKV